MPAPVRDSTVGSGASAVDLAAVQRGADQLAHSVDAAQATLVGVVPLGQSGVQQWRLANGLTVLIAPDPAAPLVAVHTWVRVGSADEVVGKTGLAHLLEHLMFKATRQHAAGVFDRTLEQMGASANAATWLDWTYYHESVPPQHLATVLELEADRLQHLDLTPVGCRSELEVVRNERRETLDDDPDGRMAVALYQAAYGTHPYGHPVIGESADLGAIQRSDIEAFYRAYYLPQRAGLILTGAVDPSVALPLLIKQYGGWSGTSTAQQTVLPKVSQPPGQVELPIEASAERLAVAWRVPAGDHRDHAALAILVEVLANAESARWSRTLVHEVRLADAVDMHLSETRGPGLLELHVILQPGKKSADALAEVDRLLADLHAHPPTEAEVRGAKNRLRMAYFREMTGVDGRAEALGINWATFGDPGRAQSWWQAVAEVAVADVGRVADTWLVPSGRAVVRGTLPVRTSRSKSVKVKGKIG